MLVGGNVDVAEPPRIVLESPESCPDAARVDAALHRALASARAPGRAWIVAMSVERTNARALRAEADISDDHGTPVAHRTLSESATAGSPAVPGRISFVAPDRMNCEGLARAVGVWASLVLDAELARAKDGQPPTRPVEAPKTQDKPQETQAADALWPAPAPEEKPSPEHDWYLHHDDTHSVELGVGAFLMAGAGTNALAGFSPYVTFETSHGLFFRPALLAGQTWTALAPPSHVDASWLALRFDTCLRLPGLYNEHRGIQLDLCAGPEGGVASVAASVDANGATVSSAGTIPYFAVGPSVDLRGELGSQLAVTLRGVGGFNIVQSSNAPDPSPASARAEVALSWGIR